MDSTEVEIAEITKHFQLLRKLLHENRGQNLIIGITTAIGALAETDIPPQERMDRARSIFKTTMGGAGTLGDFAMWNEDKEKSAALNQQLDDVLAELWDKLKCQP